MALLDAYLEQITASSQAIHGLEFPPPKIFTNAILGNHEITSLIRDTEPHERSLFTVDPNASTQRPYDHSERPLQGHATVVNRRKTIGQLQQQHGSIVAKVLGNDMLRQIQQSSRGHARSRGVDVEVLLKGAEKLQTVYPVAGAKDRISQIRNRHSQYVQSIQYYEDLVAKQQAKATRMNRNRDYVHASDEEDHDLARVKSGSAWTDADTPVDEEEIRELEATKKALEDRVAGIEKDLGGILR